MKSHYLLIPFILTVFLLSLGQEQPSSADLSIIGTMQHDIHFALTHGAEIYLLSYESHVASTPAQAVTEMGVASFKVKESILGRKLDSIALPYSFNRSRISSTGIAGPWLDPSSLVAGESILCVIAPRESPKIEGPSGVVLHMHRIQNPEDPLVQNYRKLANISKQKDEDLLRSLNDVIVDPDSLTREFARSAAVFDAKPEVGVPLLIRQWRAAESQKFPDSEISEIARALRNSFTAKDATKTQRVEGMEAFIDALGSTQKDVMRSALLQIVSVIGNKEDGFSDVRSLLPADAIASLKQRCQKISATNTSDHTLVEACRIILDWIGEG